MLRRENDGNDTLLFPDPFKRTHILVCERSDLILNHSEALQRRHVNPHSLSVSGAHEAGRVPGPAETRITRINANGGGGIKGFYLQYAGFWGFFHFISSPRAGSHSDVYDIDRGPGKWECQA